MNILRTLLPAVVIGGAIGISACSVGEPASATTAQNKTHSMLGDTIAKAMESAREKLRTGNIDVSSDHDAWSSYRNGSRWTGSRPRAQISPQGDLLIDGKPVAVTPQQRALLLDYRARILDVAEAGMQIGTQGADLASKAVGTALADVFSGKTDKQIDRDVESEADGIKQSAARLCTRLPALRDAQQKLAAALPVFRPYATMSQHDVDDCMKDNDHVHVDTDGVHVAR